MRRLAGFVLHAIAAGIMAWGWFSFLDEPMSESMMAPKGGYFVFLTHQGLVGAWSCIAISLFCERVPVRSSRSSCQENTLDDIDAIGIRHLQHLLVSPFVPPTPQPGPRHRTEAPAPDRSRIACRTLIHPLDRLFRL
ncbi:hypothetical protein OG21DRAFT_346101 [Imleria badia]|nr:hypothetical protein OG21DRAFT_346101 [Imleria badia]